MIHTILAALFVFALFPQAVDASNDTHNCEELPQDFYTTSQSTPHQKELAAQTFEMFDSELSGSESIAPEGVGFDGPLKVSYDKFSGFNTSSKIAIKNRVLKARKILEEIFDSQEFYEAVLAHKYRGRKQFTKNQGMTNLEIYNAIQLGREKGTKKADQLMNLHLVLYYSNDDVAGRTNLFSSPIYVNSKFYGGYSVAQIARNLTHEWLHNMSFSHGGLTRTQMNYSVPYGVGLIVERLARRR